MNDFAEVPEHSNNIYRLANDYYRAGKYSNAETLYQFVANSGTAGDLAIKAATEIVSCKVAAGNSDQAEQVLDTLKAAQSDHPKFYDSLFSLGERLLKLDKRDKAMKLYQYIAANTSDASMKINAQSEVVLCRISAGDAAVIDEAIARFKTDFSAHQLGSKKLNYIANALKRAGRYDKASDLFMYISQNTTDSTVAQKTGVRAIISRIQMKDYEGAEQAFEQFWNKYRTADGFVDRVVAICKIFEKVNDPAMALPYINRALEITADLKVAIRLLRLKLMCYIDMGADEQAQAVQQEIALYAEQEFYPGVQLAIADKYRKNGEHEKAIEAYDKVLNSTTDKTQQLYAHAGIGMSFVWRKDDPNVTVSLDFICNDFTDNEKLGWAVFVIGEEYFSFAKGVQRTGDFKDAEQYFYKAIAVWAKNIEMKVNKKRFSESIYLTGYAYY